MQGGSGQPGADAGDRLPDASDAPPELQGGYPVPSVHRQPHAMCICERCKLLRSESHLSSCCCCQGDEATRWEARQTRTGSGTSRFCAASTAGAMGLWKNALFTAGAAEGGARRAQRASAEEQRTAAEVLPGDRDGVDRPEMLYPAGQGVAL